MQGFLRQTPPGVRVLRWTPTGENPGSATPHCDRLRQVTAPLLGLSFLICIMGVLARDSIKGLMALHLAAEVTGWDRWAWPGVLGTAEQEGLR